MPHRSRMTIFAVALTSGLLLALAAHMLAGHSGMAFAPNWAAPTADHAALVRSALGWWLIAGTGFIGSFLAGLLMQDSPGRPGRRRLRLLAGLLFFLVLIAMPQVATGPSGGGLAHGLLANIGAFGLGLVTAFCGGWFSLAK